MRYRATILLALAVAAIAHAEKTTLKDFLADKTVPLTLQLKDLNSDWRRVNIGGAADAAAGPARAYTALLGLAGGGGGPYYTKGDTVVLEGETYLIAYRAQTKPIDYATLLRGGMRAEQMPKPEPPSPESLLALALVHLRTAGSLTDIRPFDLETELAGGDTSAAALDEARDKAGRATGLQHLRALGVALLAYAQDGDKTLPPLQDLAATRKALLPYVKEEAVFAHPDTKEPYRANAALAGKKLAAIAQPADTIVFYEAKPVSNTRGVLYLDGHCKRIPESEWPEVKRQSNLP